jgi:hypothetical protein
MVPTVYGVLILALGSYFLRKPVVWTFAMMIVCSEFGAASAVNLPVLGGSSVQPHNLALGFVVLRLLIAYGGDIGHWLPAIRENALLLGFVLYAAATAFLLPRIFEGRLLVVPLRNTADGVGIGPGPLHFSPQNITTSVYLLGTGLAAVCAGLIARDRKSTMTVITALIAVGWLHAGFGILDLLLSAVGHQDLLNVFRNGNYGQVSQGISGFRRIAGVFTETSAYSQYGMVFFVLATELWLRAILVRRTGPLALMLLVLLVLTTSSTAYLGLAVYAAVLILRAIFVPGGARPSLVVAIATIGVFGAIGVLGLVALTPGVAAKISDVAVSMTVNKGASTSGHERGMWVRQGLDAFRLSHGLGVGAGSFRSSSLATAVLGSSGVIGAAFLVSYLVKLMQPFRPSTYRADVDGLRGVGAAAAWAAALGLAPLLVVGASPDPGVVFGMLAGLSIAWRSLGAPQPSPVAAMPRRRQASGPPLADQGGGPSSLLSGGPR